MDSNENHGSGDPYNGKVTAESYGSLHLSQVDADCWLLRIPPKLASTWEAAEEGSHLGELVFVKGGGPQKLKPSFRIDIDNETAANDASLPRSYDLSAMTKKIPTLHPMERHGDGSVTVRGIVSRTANLQVRQITDANYRNLVKDRLLNNTVNSSRFVKPVEDNQVVQQSKNTQLVGGKKGFGNAVHLVGKRILDAVQNTSQQGAQASKKARFTDDQPTRSVIFELFEQQAYWSVKDLKTASGGRPENEIRDVLREIGEYHRSGDHKNTWELRKEFQQQQKSDVGAAGSASGAGDAANGNDV